MTNGTDVVQAVAACLTFAATLFGFILVYYQVRLIERQMRGDTHNTIYQHFNKICESRAKTGPVLDPYFNEGRVLTKDDPNEKVVDDTAELYADFIEHVAFQIENLPVDAVECWEKACYQMYADIPAVRSRLRKKRAIYARSVFKLLKRGKRKLRTARRTTERQSSMHSRAVHRTPWVRREDPAFPPFSKFPPISSE